ncbi:MAG: LEPR-XLL domain-containing protein [Betaproteobacteria bacterium]|nr:MAG: LEPR-XLL domain-containing protein [Betaproteobacteria bacterium]
MSAETQTTASREYRVRIPSLFQIFWSKLANWFRLLAKWRKQGLLRKALQEARRRRAMRLETLEPRVLLSADITYGALAGNLDPALDLTLKFAEDGSGNDVVRLINNDDGSTIAEQAMPSDHVINVNLTGGQLQDKLLIDFGFSGAQDAGDKSTLHVNFDGTDELLPAYTLAGLDVHSTEAVQINGDVTVAGNLDIAVMGVDAAQYTSVFDLVHADSAGTIEMTSGNVIAHSVSLTASSTINVDVTGFGLSSAQIAIADAHSLAKVDVHGGSLTSDTGSITFAATSSVTAHSTPTSDANKNATDQDAAVASVTIFSDAYVTIHGDAKLDAATTLDLTATNKVEGTANADGSKGGAGATFGLALAFTHTDASIGGDAVVSDSTCSPSQRRAARPRTRRRRPRRRTDCPIRTRTATTRTRRRRARATSRSPARSR